MEYSVIKMENGGLSYITAPEGKPEQVGIEGVKAFLDWQNKMVAYGVEEKEKENFRKFTEDQRISDGVPVPHSAMELYTGQDGRRYARLSKGLVLGENNTIVAKKTECLICEEQYVADIKSIGVTLPMCAKCTASLKRIVLSANTVIAMEILPQANEAYKSIPSGEARAASDPANSAQNDFAKTTEGTSSNQTGQINSVNYIEPRLTTNNTIVPDNTTRTD